jgi:hypothetical protein
MASEDDNGKFTMAPEIFYVLHSWSLLFVPSSIVVNELISSLALTD